MKRLKIIVEGQTEDTFVRNLLANYLYEKDSNWIEITPLLVLHSEKDGIKYKGGVRRNNGYKYITRYISNLVKEDDGAYYITMFDFYAFPQDIPNYSVAMSKSNPFDRVKFLEDQFYQDIYLQTGYHKFIPYLQLHEFEALLFTNPHAYIGYLIDSDQLNLLLKIRNSEISPEHINNGPTTAPSKRMIQIIPGYDKLKAVEGPNLAELTGIDSIRKACLHFDEWLTKLENLT